MDKNPVVKLDFVLVWIYVSSPAFGPVFGQNPIKKSQCATELNPFVMFYPMIESLKCPTESGIKSHPISQYNRTFDKSMYNEWYNIIVAVKHGEE